jgi:ubiquinone/menaquinone biosynthesis C-methylase UbiE
MMASHFLKEKERAIFINEIARVLKPQGALFFKSFYAEGDRHAKDLIENSGGGEKNSYIHPKMKYTNTSGVMKRLPSHLTHNLSSNTKKRRTAT